MRLEIDKNGIPHWALDPGEEVWRKLAASIRERTGRPEPPIRTGRLAGEPSFHFRLHRRQVDFLDAGPTYAFYGGCRQP